MKILIIPDKFKGSLTASEVIAAVEQGILNVYPDALMVSVIASDGGDGFLDAVGSHIEVESITTKSIDPLGREIDANYLFDVTNNTAYLELAKTSGVELLLANERSAMDASTFGTGIQLKYAIENGAKNIYIGLGGSATNDGGVGIAHALGYRFLDRKGNVLAPIGKNLAVIASIQNDEVPNLDGVSIIAINDVDNPLFGQYGAAYTYARQKGATDQEIDLLDKGLSNLNEVVKSFLHQDVALVPGSGAAGGTGFGLKAFLHADFITGIEFVLELAGVGHLMNKHKFDFILTGEGKLDDQTMHGKLIKGVIDLGLEHSIPVVAVCGQLDMDQGTSTVMGLHKTLEIMRHDKPLAYNLGNASDLITQKITAFFEEIKTGMS